MLSRKVKSNDSERKGPITKKFKAVSLFLENCKKSSMDYDSRERIRIGIILFAFCEKSQLEMTF